MNFVKSILLFYYHSPRADASTVMEHIDSFESYSRYEVIKINTFYGIPFNLYFLKFSFIIFHYSLFGTKYFKINKKVKNYILKCDKSIKIAFFQDEYTNCLERFKFLNDYRIDYVYSLLNPIYFDKVYLRNSNVKSVIPTLTGYVSDDLIIKSKKYQKPFEFREIDIGYRARELPFFYGSGAREKSEIAVKFKEITERKFSFRLDISTLEEDRIYGDDWYKFLGNCKFTLGVMAGTSIFDLTGEIERNVDSFLNIFPNATFDVVKDEILKFHEEKINYRTISPRIFEAAASNTCMVLFKDSYQGILQPNIHYISLEKDFSNIDEVVYKMNNQVFVDKILYNAFNELILNEKYHYRSFITELDSHLNSLSLNFSYDEIDFLKIKKSISSDFWFRYIMANLKSIRNINFPGRIFLKLIVHKLGRKINI
jgi:hypothetical protein